MCEVEFTGSLGTWSDFIVYSQHRTNTQTYISLLHLLRWPYPCANRPFGPGSPCPILSSSVLDPFFSSVFFPPPHSNSHLLMSLVTFTSLLCLSDLWLWTPTLPSFTHQGISRTKVLAPVYDDYVSEARLLGTLNLCPGDFLTSDVELPPGTLHWTSMACRDGGLRRVPNFWKSLWLETGMKKFSKLGKY